MDACLNWLSGYTKVQHPNRCGFSVNRNHPAMNQQNGRPDGRPRVAGLIASLIRRSSVHSSP